MSNSSIWPIDRTLSDTTTLGQSGLGSNGNGRVLHIPQSITGASPSDCLVSSPGHLLGEVGESYPSAEMQLVYFAALADWATGYPLGKSYPYAKMKSVYFTA